MHPFREAVERGDHDRIIGLLADDVVFRSPVVHTPYHGREATAQILTAVSTVFEDFRYLSETTSADGRETVLVFAAHVGDKQLQGVDILHTEADGKVDALTVMIRPLSGIMAVAELMRQRLGVDS